MSCPSCPSCDTELIYEEPFGNLDFAMESAGIPRGDCSPRRKPVKAGDIYSCPACECSYHTFDGNDAVIEGRPC